MNRNIFRRRTIYLLLVAFFVLLPVFTQHPYYLHILIMVGTAVTLTASLRIIMTTGQPSLAHAAFMGIGAYTSALLVMRLGWSFWLAFPLGGVAAGVAALLVGYPTLRIKGAYFAIVTLAFSELFRLGVSYAKGLTGGVQGLPWIPVPNPITIPGLFQIEFVTKTPFYYFVLILALFTILVAYRLDKSRLGLIFLSILQSDTLAESIGVNLTRYKVLAFAIGAILAGMMGSLYAHYNGTISPIDFQVWVSIFLLIYLVVGGTRRVEGAVIGPFLLVFLPELLRLVQSIELLIYAMVLILVVRFLPEGLVSLPDKVSSWARRLREMDKEARKGLPAVSEGAVASLDVSHASNGSQKES